MLGIDKGTTYTKTDRKLCIRSTIRKYRENDIMLHDDKTLFEMDGQKWIIGEKGNYSTDLMKSKHSNTKMLILLAIGLSYSDDYIVTDIVTGLPIGLYSTQKQMMKSMFHNTSHEVKINGMKKIIRIKNTEVFPEGAGAFYSQSDYLDALIIDIGGLSIDTALFRNKKLIKYSTYSMGIMKLYSKLANKINSDYDLSFTEWDMENVLKEGLYIYGKPAELNIDDLVIEHTKEILERLTLEYDIKSIKNILITGGPAEWIHSYFIQDIPQIRLLNNNQFSNAIGYRNIGQVLFHEKNQRF